MKPIRLGDVFEVSNERLGEYAEEPPVFAISKYDGVVLGSDYHERRVASDKLNTYKTLGPAGWAYSTIHIDEGSIARNSHDFLGVVSPMYTILRWTSEDHDPRYFEHLLRSPEMLATYGDMAQGSINRRRSLPWKTFSSISVSVPTINEQRRTVDLIGAVDKAIDAADEQANTLWSITHRLLDNSFKGFPLVHVGDLLAGISGGKSPSAEGRPPVAEEYGVLKVSAVSELGFLPSESKTVDNPNIFNASMSVRAGDILISRANTPERVGLACLVDDDYPNLFLSDKTLRLVPKAGVDPASLVAVLATSKARTQIQMSGTGSSGSMKNISQEAIRQLSVGWPADPEEQGRIGSLNKSQLDVISKLRATADSLRSLRAELLSALLSGAHRIPETYDELMGADSMEAVGV
ncbi:hypothetical protein [Arthrobacter sp. 2MCAF14]|uniref:hypothetical protein n=1 Tax=Arthrobacter sp. 2MCAF14 TaxID=3232982 RepID=UPI003F929FAB